LREIHDVCWLISPSPWAVGWRASALAGSVVLHAAVFAAVVTSAGGTTGPSEGHYRLQILHLEPTKPRVERAADSTALWHVLRQDRALPRKGMAADRRSEDSSGQTLQTLPARQTLIVRDAPPEIKLTQTLPLPLAFSWVPIKPLPPVQQKVRIAEPEPVSRVPSKQDTLPSTAPAIEIISIPDVPVQTHEAIAVPKVKQLAEIFTGPGALGSGAVPSPADTGSPSAAPGANHNVSSQPEAISAKTLVSPTGQELPGSTPQNQQSNHAAEAKQLGDGPVLPSGEKAPNSAGLTRIELPPGSKPRTSVMGESVAERYPETAGLMRGRVVSTVYLHVGLPKSWLLEYWSPAGSEAAGKGRITTLDAPWPQVILRPSLEFPASADALLIRGLLTTEGTLTQLSLVLPTEWTGQNPLLDVLEQWKFRPAMRNGQAVPVEILLVVPRQAVE
jgi:hypothetical protein